MQSKTGHYGWKARIKKKQCSPDLTDFWNYRDELSFVNGLIMKGQKIVIPKKLISKMMEILRKGHAGCERTLRRARDTMF